MGLLSLALNSDARVAPDMLHELRCAVESAVDSGIISRTAHGRLFVGGDLLPKVDLRDALTSLLNEEGDDSELFLALAPNMCVALDEMFARFPLVKPADTVVATLQAVRTFSAAVKESIVPPAPVLADVALGGAAAAPGAPVLAATSPHGVRSSATAPLSRVGGVLGSAVRAPGSQADTARSLGASVATFASAGAAVAAAARAPVAGLPSIGAGLGRAPAAEAATTQPLRPAPFRWSAATVIQAPGGARLQRPVPSPRALAKLLNDAMLATVPETQRHVRMHEAMTAADWRKMIAEVRNDAAKLSNFCRTHNTSMLRVVVFVDELNTSNILGMIKEAFVDHSCDGVMLPSNVVFFGAVNPNDPAGAARGAAATAANVGVWTDTEDEKYVVFEMPLSLKALVVSVSSMTPTTEGLFLKAFLDPKNGALPIELRSDAVTAAITDVFKDAVLFSQQFVRDARLHRMDASIRDINRAVIFYRFFSDLARREAFMPVNDLTHPHDFHWRAVLLALGVVYYLRFPTTPRKEARDGLRAAYVLGLFDALRGAVEGYRTRDRVGDVFRALSDARERLPFQVVWRDSVQRVFEGTQIPRGIAPTLSLQECIFVCVVCAEACVPCQIVGPPGCVSCSLCATIAYGLIVNILCAGAARH